MVVRLYKATPQMFRVGMLARSQNSHFTRFLAQLDGATRKSSFIAGLAGC